MSEPVRENPLGRPPRPRERNIWLLLACFALGLLVYNSFLKPRSASKLETTSAQADFDWKLVDLAGDSVSLEKFRGRPLFLNVWATWCPPCVAEMPSIERLAANPRVKKAGAAVVAISLGEEPDTVARFVSSRGLDEVAVLRTEVPPPSVFATEGIPATFIVAPDGRIVRFAVGGQEWDRPDVIELLESLAQPG